MIEQRFREAIRNEPEEMAHRCAFADWLCEHGDERLGAFMQADIAGDMEAACAILNGWPAHPRWLACTDTNAWAVPGRHAWTRTWKDRRHVALRLVAAVGAGDGRQEGYVLFDKGLPAYFDGPMAMWARLGPDLVATHPIAAALPLAGTWDFALLPQGDGSFERVRYHDGLLTFVFIRRVSWAAPAALWPADGVWHTQTARMDDAAGLAGWRRTLGRHMEAVVLACLNDGHLPVTYGRPGAGSCARAEHLIGTAMLGWAHACCAELAREREQALRFTRDLAGAFDARKMPAPMIPKGFIMRGAT